MSSFFIFLCGINTDVYLHRASPPVRAPDASSTTSKPYFSSLSLVPSPLSSRVSNRSGIVIHVFWNLPTRYHRKRKTNTARLTRRRYKCHVTGVKRQLLLGNHFTSFHQFEPAHRSLGKSLDALAFVIPPSSDRFQTSIYPKWHSLFSACRPRYESKSIGCYFIGKIGKI